MAATQAAPDRTRPRESVDVVFDHELLGAPGKSVVGLRVALPPGGWTPPHRHGGAQVVAVVQDGELRSAMDGEPPRVYRPGQAFMEPPGCHHAVSDNNSPDAPCAFLAVLVVDTDVVRRGGYEALNVIDDGW